MIAFCLGFMVGAGALCLGVLCYGLRDALGRR